MGNVSLDRDALDVLQKWLTSLRNQGRSRASFSDVIKHLDGVAEGRRR